MQKPQSSPDSFSLAPAPFAGERVRVRGRKAGESPGRPAMAVALRVPFLLLLVLLSPILLAGAQSLEQTSPPSTADRLTLDQALALAFRHQPELAAARASFEAAGGRVQQAGLFPNPEAIGGVEAAPFQGRTFREAEYLAGLSQAIPLSDRLGKARTVEERNREQTLHDLEIKAREARRNVHAAFATALYQSRALQDRKALADSLERSVNILKARVDAGDAVPMDLSREEIEWTRARLETGRAKSLREQAMLALKTSIGLPAIEIQSLDGTLESAFDLPALETLSIELDQHPALARARAEVETQEARLDLARAERIPDINVEVLYRRLEAEKRNSFDIGIRIPLPIFDRNQGKLRELRAETDAARSRARATADQLNLQWQGAVVNLKSGLERARLLRNEILPRMKSVMDAAEARHGAGELSLSELLMVRRDWMELQLTHLEALRDVMAAWAEVSHFLKQIEPIR